MGVCDCSMFCCALLYVHFSIAIIMMGKRELIALLNLSSWCLMVVEWLFLAVPRGCLQFVIVVFPDHTHLLFFKTNHRLMQVKSIAECSKGSILQYFEPSLSYHLSLRSLFCLFLSGYITQVLLYTNGICDTKKNTQQQED